MKREPAALNEMCHRFHFSAFPFKDKDSELWTISVTIILLSDSHNVFFFVSLWLAVHMTQKCLYKHVRSFAMANCALDAQFIIRWMRDVRKNQASLSLSLSHRFLTKTKLWLWLGAMESILLWRNQESFNPGDEIEEKTKETEGCRQFGRGIPMCCFCSAFRQ